MYRSVHECSISSDAAATIDPFHVDNKRDPLQYSLLFTLDDADTEPQHRPGPPVEILNTYKCIQGVQAQPNRCFCKIYQLSLINTGMAQIN